MATVYTITEDIRTMLIDIAIDRCVNTTDLSHEEEVANRLGISVAGDYYTIVDEVAYTMTVLRMVNNVGL